MEQPPCRLHLSIKKDSSMNYITLAAPFIGK